MSRKKGKRTYNTKKKQAAARNDMMVFIIIVISILLAVLIYTKSGFIGSELSEIFGGMFGIIEYILPIGAFIVGIKMAYDKDDNLSSKLILYLALLISLSLIISVIQVSFGELNPTNEISVVAKDAYQMGVNGQGGGALGGILAVPLVNLLGIIGAIIVSVGATATLAIIIFGINMSEIISKHIDNAKDRREERLRYKMETREEAKNRHTRHTNNTREMKKGRNVEQIDSQIKDDDFEKIEKYL